MAHFPNGKREGVALARVGFQKVLYGIKASSTRVKKKDCVISLREKTQNNHFWFNCRVGDVNSERA